MKKSLFKRKFRTERPVFLNKIGPDMVMPTRVYADKDSSSLDSITVWGGWFKAKAVCKALNYARKQGIL